MCLFNILITLHLTSVALTISLFTLRYWWRWSNNPRFQARWVRVLPHIVDSVLLLSGVGLIALTGYLPFTVKGAWLTEKLFGVIIYIALGFIALGRKPRAQKTRWIAFIVAAAMLVMIYHLATTKMPLLGNV